MKMVVYLSLILILVYRLFVEGDKEVLVFIGFGLCKNGLGLGIERM